MPGSARGRAPVAMMMFLACRCPRPARSSARSLRLDRLLGRRHLDLAGAGHLGLAPDDVDLVLLHQELTPLFICAAIPRERLTIGLEVEAELFRRSLRP
jgi:hypothetical protein